MAKNPNLPKAPDHDIRWGMLQPACEVKFRDWIINLIEEAIKDPTKRVDIAYTIYDEVLQLGYDYGTDAAEEDRAWEEG